MNTNNNENLKYHQQFLQLWDGTLSDQESQKLTELLSSDVQLRQFYLEFMSVNVCLHQLNDPVEDLIGVINDDQLQSKQILQDAIEIDQYRKELLRQQEASKNRTKVKKQAEDQLKEYLDQHEIHQKNNHICSRPNLVQKRSFEKGLKALAACLIIGLCFWLLVTPTSLYDVAKITYSHEAQWGVEPDKFYQDKKYHLISGLAEIEFNDGAKIILEGPSQITFESANGAYLDHGKLTAQVPERAKGFTIVTPISSVVDFGTEFGIEVDSNASVLVHVFKGSVGIRQSRLDHKDFTMIKQGQGKRLKKIDGDLTVIDVPGKQAYFSNQLNKKWDDNQVASISLYQQYIQSLNPDYYFPFELSLESMEGVIGMNGTPKVVSMGAELYKDQTNYALELNSEKQYVILDVFQRKEKRKTFSMMLWVKQINEQTDISPLLYSATFNETGYPVIALYLENQSIVFDSVTTCDRQKDVDYILVSKSDISPNQWACIVVTKKENGDLSLYVNGKHDKTINKGTDCPLFGWEDICLGYNSNIVDEATRGIFDGYIDEVAFFDYVLSSEEIENIYKHDSLAKNKNNN